MRSPGVTAASLCFATIRTYGLQACIQPVRQYGASRHSYVCSNVQSEMDECRSKPCIRSGYQCQGSQTADVEIVAIGQDVRHEQRRLDVEMGSG